MKTARITAAQSLDFAQPPKVRGSTPSKGSPAAAGMTSANGAKFAPSRGVLSGVRPGGKKRAK